MRKFIAVEGLDLAGKSSVIIPYLKEKLPDAEFVADLKTGLIASKIRDIFMDASLVNESTDYRTIAFLSAAARSDLVSRNIIPALNAGKTVVSDRYVDTSFVYNKGSHLKPIDTILHLSTHLEYPTDIIFAYCSYEEMVKRAGERDKTDSWDIKGREQYDEILLRYKEQLYKRASTVHEIDTSGPIELVHTKLDMILPSLQYTND